MASAYDTLQQELAAKGRALAEIFDAMGPDRDTTKAFDKVPGAKSGDDVISDIRRRNDELTDLGKRFDAEREVKNIADRLARPAVGAPLPGNDQGRKANPYDRKTMGDVFLEHMAEIKGRNGQPYELDLGDPRNGGVELKTLLDRTAWSIEPDRLAVIVPGVLRRPVVADLMPQGTTNSNQIKYMEQTTDTNATAAVSEGAAKPESAMVFSVKTANVEKLAAVLPVTDELFEDGPALQSFIEARMRLHLQIAEENALLTGSGTTPQIRGLLNFTGVQTQALGADSRQQAIFKAITLIRANAFTEPSGVVIHPNAWQAIAMSQSADGGFLWASRDNNFANAGPERLWGLPVVITTAITATTALVGAFDTAAQIFRRNLVSFAVADQHSTDFVFNKLMLRIEERLALACYRPSAFATVTGI